jgi:hypothetical protein
MKSEKQLYQWDVNQHLTELQPTAQFVDYPMGNEVIRIETDGKRCRIPDEFLQTAGFKTCYERYSDGTYKAYSFNVQSSPKPPDYVYTAEERTTFEALVEKADAAIDEIKRRADSGEFTPKKGVDYFTDSEKNEMMESVSSGAIGEFRKVVGSATTELSDNHNLMLAKYNANASEKLTTYDINAEQHTTDYNRNAEQKLEAYNQNHTEKVAEYNQNAENKTAEFDSNAATLQTEVDRLRGECDQLAAENRKQENRISALMKLNKGQTYDILPEEGETVSRTVPSGAKYVSVDKVGGKSIVWNQLFNMSQNNRVDGGQFEINFDSQTVTLNGNSGNNAWLSIIPDDGAFASLNLKKHQYIYKIFVVENQSAESIRFGFLNRGFVANIPANYTGQVNFVCTVSDPEKGKTIGFSGLQANTNYAIKIVLTACDLTLMFGAGNEPTAEQFEAMFPAESYPYNPGEIISSRTETITAGAESITTGFPELHSAGIAHDEIDMDGGEVHRNIDVIDLGTLDWEYNSDYRFMLARVLKKKKGHANLLCPRYKLSPSEVWVQGSDGVYGGNNQNNIVYIKDTKFTEPLAFKEAMKGVVLNFELEAQTTEPVTIPEALQEWLPVEPGGTVTFRNADESKQLAVPNSVSWVRKLDEVE